MLLALGPGMHAAIMRAAKNKEFVSAVKQAAHKTQMLSATTIRFLGRPLHALQEHRQLIELIANHKCQEAQELVGKHILSALQDIVKHGFG